MSKKRTNDIPEPRPLVEVRRGSITESRHRGHIAAVDTEGQIVAHLGVPGVLTYMRSSAKPFQSLPLVASGAADRFGFTTQEIAIACASHNGEPIHTETVAAMLRKIGMPESALKCGVHEPFSAEEAARLRERGEKPGVLHNNCSGKHAGMLALALHLGAPTDTYDQPDNPVQLMIARTIELFSDVPLEDIAVGVDGCGAPVFGVTVRAMALMYARFVQPPEDWPNETRKAAERIVSAMISHPEIIGGREERLDTVLMRATRGRVVSKVGAEGVYTAGVLPSERWPRGLGLAFKIEDGEDRRARPTVVIEALRQLGVLEGAALDELAPYESFTIRNHRGDAVGEVRANFELELS
ncbi:MAG TPA: asparaginase [Pyrinomonadaceae bacterium]|jgi:L-asparaginase II|nr:asparaginase [Pyrinomonadaceae bacterium]